MSDRELCPCLSNGECLIGNSFQVRSMIRRGRLSTILEVKIETSGLLIKARHRMKVRNAVNKAVREFGAEHLHTTRRVSGKRWISQNIMFLQKNQTDRGG
jgi:hypothetical protein